MSDPRPYIRVSDSIADNPKMVAVDDDAASWLLVAMWGYSHREDTDGRVPQAVAHRMTKSASKRLCQKLITAGLLQVEGQDYICHDYLEHQQSAEQRAAARERAAIAGRAGGLAKGQRTVKRAASKPLSKNEAEVEIEVQEQSPTDSPPVAALPDGFAEFWEVYPRRVGRGHAVKAWKAATKKTTADVIVSGAASFALSVRGTEQKFIPHPSSWLNAERWADERPQLRAVNDGSWYPGKGGSWDV